MSILKSLVFALISLCIITACVATKWKPTSFYSKDNIQSTTPIKGEHIVIIYSTKWCYWCKVAKKFMKKHNIKYIEQNLEDPLIQKKLKKFAKRIGYTERLDAVPIFVINNKIYVGYNSEQILSAIGRKKTNVKLFTTWETPLKQ